MKLILAMLAIMAHAHGEALSFIGLCSDTWDCNKTIASFGTRPVTIGWLEESFSRGCVCADKIAQLPQRKTFRVHLANGPCLRNQRCGRHDVFYNHTIASANRAVRHPRSRVMRRFEALLQRVSVRFAGTKRLRCYVSPVLESDLNERARKVLLARVSVVLPTCLLVDNPVRGACVTGTVCERHGRDPGLFRPCIADLDGTEAKTNVDLQRFRAETSQCKLRFYWTSWMNCNQASWVLPDKRQCNVTKQRLNAARRNAWKLL